MDIIHYLKPVIDWLHIHPHWAGFVTFLISLTESLAIMGYLMPGSVMMTAVGTLIGAGIIPIWSTLGWAILGAIAGDGLSYRLGYHFKDDIHGMWPFRRYPKLLNKSETFFHKHGGKSVFLGRFVGAVRPMVPLIAGMLRLEPWRFYLSNVFSAILWAPAYMVPGMLVGAATLQLDPKAATELVLWILSALILIGLTFWLIKILVTKLIHFMHVRLDRLWAFLLRHPSFRPLCLALQDPYHPDSHGQLTLAFIFLLVFTLAIIVSINVIGNGSLTLLNDPIHHFFRSIQTANTSKVVILLTLMGDKLVLLPTSAVIFMVFAVQKQWRAALHWLAAILLCAGFAYVIKEFSDYPRPLDIVAPNISNSFPSGHTALSVIFFGFFAILIAHNYERWVRSIIYAVSIILSTSIALSRLYLGAHWLTDIIGGMLIALSALILVTISYRRQPYPKLRLAKVYWIGALTYLLVYGILFSVEFNSLVQGYRPIWPSKQITISEWWQPVHPTPYLWNNRFGVPLHLMNVQWADELHNIQAQLQRNDWYLVPKQTFLSTLGRFAKKSNIKHLPLLPSSYEGQNPVLLMVKPVNDHVLLVLRLWDSRIDFTDNTAPLWIGTINYQLARNAKFWETQKHYQQLPPAILSLQGMALANQWHVVTYPLVAKPKQILTPEWQAGTVLLRPADKQSLSEEHWFSPIKKFLF